MTTRDEILAEAKFEAAMQQRDEALDEVERLTAFLDRSEKLLEYVYVLRAYGEGADGGNETWREFDNRLEAFLRELVDRRVA